MKKSVLLAALFAAVSAHAAIPVDQLNGWQYPPAPAVEDAALIPEVGNEADAEGDAPNLLQDAVYEAETGESVYPTGATEDVGNIDPILAIGTEFEGLLHRASGCSRGTCAVWAVVSRASQTITIYVNGSPVGLKGGNRTSTGMRGFGTPAFDKHPDGRVYTKYSSGKYPGGDYNGLGNMPYAVFIRGGYAIHGTPRGNWGKLGSPASHGCIRVHPATGQQFNALVRQYGVSNTWITVQ